MCTFTHFSVVNQQICDAFKSIMIKGKIIQKSLKSQNKYWNLKTQTKKYQICDKILENKYGRRYAISQGWIYVQGFEPRFKLDGISTSNSGW